ncbi:MAG: hypothetical protein AB1Z23_05895 [Eubacteriales bacterium]
MENDLKMEIDKEISTEKKSKLPIIGIAAAALLLIIIVVFAVFNSPKVLMGILVKNTPDTVTEFFEAEKAELPLYMTESHESETKISMDAESLGLDGDIELELHSGYQNDTGEFAAEMELGLGDMDAITAGIFLDQSEVALISSLLSEKYVIDIEPILSAKDDKELQALMDRAEKKVKELRNLAIKTFPGKAFDKGKDDVEIFGKDTKLSYVEVSMDEDQFKEWAEEVLNVVAEDKELEDLIVEIGEYLNDKYDMGIETDDIDIEDECDDAIDELDDMEAEMSVRIYRKGFTPVAYEISYKDDYSEGEGIVLLYESGKKVQMFIDADFDGDKLYYNVYADDDDYSIIEYELDGMSYEIVIEKVKNGVYEISGEIDYGYGMKGKISGEMTESKNEMTMEMKMKMDDGTETNQEMSKIIDGAITTVEYKMVVSADGEDQMKFEWESETEEIKKNKEYATEGELKITEMYTDTEYVIEVENSLIYGDEVDLNLPSWSKSDVYAKVSDNESLQDLFDKLGEDFQQGYFDAFSMMMYGDMY